MPPEGAPAKRPRAAALAVAAGIFLSRVAGLARERIFAHYLGGSDAAAAFTAAMRIPNFLQTLFGEGVLSASFIPVYSRLLAEGREEDAGKVAGAVASLLLLVISFLVALGTAGAPFLIPILAPGFDGEMRAQTVRLVQIVFPGVGLLVFSAWCLGVLNSHKRFFLSYVTPVVWNAAQIAMLVVFGARMLPGRAGEMRLSEWMAWGTVLGATLQLALMLPPALRLAGGLKPSLDLSFEPVGRVVRNFFPVLLSRGVVQLSALIDGALASLIDNAAIWALGYASRIYTLPVSLFGMAISAAELPEMSRAVGSNEEIARRLRGRLEVSLARIAFYIVPSCIAFLALGDVVAATLYETGKFSTDETRFVWFVLAGSAIGLLAATEGRLCASAFWALSDTRTPLKWAIVRVAITTVGGWAMALPLRHAFDLSAQVSAFGLTASAGVAGWVEFLLLRGSLERRIGRLDRRHALAFKTWAAGLLAGAAAFALHHTVSFAHPVLRGAVVLGLFGGVYMGAALLFGVEEARAFARRLRILR